MPGGAVARCEASRVTQAEIVEELRAVAGAEHVLTAEEDLLAYGYDGTWYESRPLAVVLPGPPPRSRSIHGWHARAHRHHAARYGQRALRRRGAAAKSLVLGVMRMNRILEIDEVNRVAVVQAGVINADLQRDVEAPRSLLPARSRRASNSQRSAATFPKTPAARVA